MKTFFSRTITVTAFGTMAASLSGCGDDSSLPVVRTTPAPTTQVPGTTSYAGPSVDMEWGPVQITILVKNRKIITVQATGPTERPRSAFINSVAFPELQTEVLQAQSANNAVVSGATLTSQAYDESLQAALIAAHL